MIKSINKTIKVIPLALNLIMIIFVLLVLAGIFEDEKYLDFRVSYSKGLSLFFGFFIPINCIVGIILNLKKQQRKILIAILITSFIAFFLTKDFYDKLSPW